MRIPKTELLILRLKNDLPPHPRLDHLREMTAEECLERLRTVNGVDFGNDVEQWEKWWNDRKASLGLDEL